MRPRSQNSPRISPLEPAGGSLQKTYTGFAVASSSVRVPETLTACRTAIRLPLKNRGLATRACAVVAMRLGACAAVETAARTSAIASVTDLDNLLPPGARQHGGQRGKQQSAGHHPHRAFVQDWNEPERARVVCLPDDIAAVERRIQNAGE